MCLRVLNVLVKGDLVMSKAQSYLGLAMVLQTYSSRRCKVYWIKSGIVNLMSLSALAKLDTEVK